MTVTKGTDPDSTGIAVSADLSSIGGSATQALTDNNDGTWTLSLQDGGQVFSKTVSFTSSGLSAEWIMEAPAIGGRVAHRPHFAGYSDQPGRELSFSVWMLEQQRALRPPPPYSDGQLRPSQPLVASLR